MNSSETKTEKKIKEAFVRELNERQFEEIHVSDVCRDAHVSRVTFYNWYSDKFELLDAIFHDMVERISRQLDERQKENNPEDDPIQGYINLLDVILESQQDTYDFIKQAENNKDSWLYYYYYTTIRKGIQVMMDRYSGQISPRFASQQTSAFICGGLWDFIHTCRMQKMEQKDIQKQAEDLLRAILTSDAFTK